MTALVMMVPLVMMIPMGEGDRVFRYLAGNAAAMVPVRHLMPRAMGGFRKRSQNNVTSLPELLGVGQRLEW